MVPNNQLPAVLLSALRDNRELPLKPERASACVNLPLRAELRYRGHRIRSDRGSTVWVYLAEDIGLSHCSERSGDYRYARASQAK
jgi:hypothetical protein